MYSILLDEETENIAVYDDYVCVYSKNLKDFNGQPVSYDTLLDIAVYQLKEYYRRKCFK